MALVRAPAATIFNLHARAPPGERYASGSSPDRCLALRPSHERSSQPTRLKVDHCHSRSYCRRTSIAEASRGTGLRTQPARVPPHRRPQSGGQPQAPHQPTPDNTRYRPLPEKSPPHASDASRARPFAGGDARIISWDLARGITFILSPLSAAGLEWDGRGARRGRQGAWLAQNAGDHADVPARVISRIRVFRSAGGTPHPPPRCRRGARRSPINPPRIGSPSPPPAPQLRGRRAACHGFVTGAGLKCILFCV